LAKYKVYKNPHNGHTERVKDGFNWVVFFFGPLWYLFNGLVAQGIGWLVIALIIGVPTLGLGSIVVWIIAGCKANTEKEKRYLENGWQYVGYEGEENISLM